MPRGRSSEVENVASTCLFLFARCVSCRVLGACSAGFLNLNRRWRLLRRLQTPSDLSRRFSIGFLGADAAGFGRATLPLSVRSGLAQDLGDGDLLLAVDLLHRVEVLLLDPVLGDYGCAM